MNIAATIELHGGGPGSGCNPDKGKCGRPKGRGMWKAGVKGIVDKEDMHSTAEELKGWMKAYRKNAGSYDNEGAAKVASSISDKMGNVLRMRTGKRRHQAAYLAFRDNKGELQGVADIDFESHHGDPEALYEWLSSPGMGEVTQETADRISSNVLDAIGEGEQGFVHVNLMAIHPDIAGGLRGSDEDPGKELIRRIIRIAQRKKFGVAFSRQKAGALTTPWYIPYNRLDRIKNVGSMRFSGDKIMGMAATLEVYGGGPGSGCNPSKGKCGRPKKRGANVKKTRKKLTLPQRTNRSADEKMMRRIAENERGALKISKDDKAGRRVMKRLLKQKLVSKRVLSHTYKLTKKGAATAFALRRTGTGRPQRMVKLTFKSPTKGFVFTQYEMSKKGTDKGKRGPTDLTKKAHLYRGNFRRGTDLRVQKAEGQEITSTLFEAGDPLGKSSTIMIWRDIASGKLLVSEWTKEESNIIGMKKFKFANFIKGQGFLRRRYGVALKAPTKMKLSETGSFKFPKSF